MNNEMDIMIHVNHKGWSDSKFRRHISWSDSVKLTLLSVLSL